MLLKANVQVVVIDTVGNWYGLRLDADGKSKGFDVPVFGGLRGDLPLQAQAGELVADVAVDHTGGHFSNSIGPLGGIGLIRRNHGVVTPTEILFPPGLS